MRTARLTARGLDAFAKLGRAGDRLLDCALIDWSDADREDLGRLLLRFVQGRASLSRKASKVRELTMMSAVDNAGRPRDFAPVACSLI